MDNDPIWVVQYLRAATSGGRRLTAERPRVYRIAAFSGDAVWGINVDTQVLTRVNREAADGSGRVMNMRAFPDPAAARLAAERIVAEIDAEQVAHEERVAAAAAAKAAAQRAKYPSVLPAEQDAAVGEERSDQDQDQDEGGSVQVGVSYSIKRAEPAGSGGSGQG